jgi:uncharacterized protein YegL
MPRATPKPKANQPANSHLNDGAAAPLDFAANGDEIRVHTPSPEVSSIAEFPILILVDQSGSMTGPKLAAANKGLNFAIDIIKSDFDSKAGTNLTVVGYPGKNGQPYEVLVDCMPARAVNPITLSIQDGGTPMGAALKAGIDILMARYDELRLNQQSVHKPLLFNITDSYATDDVSEATRLIRELDVPPGAVGRPKGKLAAFGLLVGSPDVPTELQNIFWREVQGITPEALVAYFKMVAEICKVMSRSRPGDTIPLPEKPGNGWPVL